MKRRGCLTPHSRTDEQRALITPAWPTILQHPHHRHYCGNLVNCYDLHCHRLHYHITRYDPMMLSSPLHDQQFYYTLIIIIVIIINIVIMTNNFTALASLSLSCMVILGIRNCYDFQCCPMIHGALITPTWVTILMHSHHNHYRCHHYLCHKLHCHHVQNHLITYDPMMLSSPPHYIWCLGSFSAQKVKPTILCRDI